MPDGYSRIEQVVESTVALARAQDVMYSCEATPAPECPNCGTLGSRGSLSLSSQDDNRPFDWREMIFWG